MPYVDFAELKTRITIEQVIRMLGLALKKSGAQLRGECPVCHAGGDRVLVVTPLRGIFYCFSGKVGGDMISLAAHVQNCSANEAAQAINRHFGGTVTTLPVRQGTVTTVPPKPKGEREGDRTLQPLAYLQAGHEVVAALGVSQATAETFGAGYASKGIMRGRLAIPIHDGTGTLVAYCGRAVKGESPSLVFPNGSVLVSSFSMRTGSSEGSCT